MDNEIIDLKFIYDYIYEQIEKNYLNNYIETIKVDNEINILGEYNYINKSILIGLEANKIYYDKQLKLIKKNNIINTNTFILTTINHELEHAIQYKHLTENNDIVSKLFKESFLNLTYHNDIYQKYHDLFLIEHNAIYNSLLKTNHLFSNIESENKIDLLNQLKFFITKQYENKSPYEKINHLLNRNGENDFSQFSNKQKINLGLPTKNLL